MYISLWLFWWACARMSEYMSVCKYVFIQMRLLGIIYQSTGHTFFWGFSQIQYINSFASHPGPRLSVCRRLSHTGSHSGRPALA